MQLNEYQDKARATAIFPRNHPLEGVTYCALKLNGEAGGVAEKIGKVIRDDNYKISMAKHEELLFELGDVLWYVANLAVELGVSLETVAEMNLAKLKRRKEKNTLQGSGDHR